MLKRSDWVREITFCVRSFSMKLQQLLSQVRKAIDDYQMIQEGDVIAVGLSGGKDSMTLLHALKELSGFYPHPFQLIAITVDLGFDHMDLSTMEEYCKELHVPFHVVRTQIAEIVFENKHQDSPCSLCSRLRKGALNRAAQELGCNKTAFGHHRDDVIETMMLSLLFEGRIHTFAPVTELDRTQLTLIRPLLYVKEADIKGFVNKYHIPVLKNACPCDGATNRQYVKDVIDHINKDLPGVRDRMFTAAKNACLDISEQIPGL